MQINMKTIFHKADERGKASFGWLNSHHSFSFGHYYDAEKMGFGLLRVLNDDTIIGGSGFGTHPHDNMEIISIPLSGALEHNDSTGTQSVIHANDVQIMSAGSGISHSEFNHFKDKTTNFLQIWVLPKLKNITPRYNQKTFKVEDRINKLQTVVSPDDAQAVWINQDAWFSMARLQQGKSLEYAPQKNGNGVYVFVLEGVLVINDQQLSKRDALGIWDTEVFNLTATAEADILVIDIPMNEA